jgi:hypothetical protein
MIVYSMDQYRHHQPERIERAYLHSIAARHFVVSFGELVSEKLLNLGDGWPEERLHVMPDAH